MKTNYLKMDMERLLKGKGLYWSILGVTVTLLFSLEDNGIINNSIILTYVMSTEFSGMMIAYIFCAFPYATVFCEDLENKYIRYEVIKGNVKKYVLSKISIIYLSSITTMVLGSILFMLLVRFRAPWADFKIDDLSLLTSGSYAFLIEQEHYVLYCVLYSFQLGLLAGTFSVMASFLSLFISNKVTTLVLPILIYQVLLEYSGMSKFTVFSFRAYNKPFAYDWQYFLFVVLLSAVPTLILTIGTFKKIKTRL